jgi:glutathione S-transferase
VKHQVDKVDRRSPIAEATLSTPAPTIHVGHIALACALGYLDLRFGGRWREGHPRLVAWLEDFEERVPSFGETRIQA